MKTINNVFRTVMLAIAITSITLNFATGINVTSEGKISGRIICEETGRPAGFMTISLYACSDSSLVAGTVSDLEGYFSFYMLENKSYYIVISDTGFIKKSIAEIKINSDQQKMELGEIFLTPCQKQNKKKQRGASNTSDTGKFDLIANR